jgi:hypothetical protein
MPLTELDLPAGFARLDSFLDAAARRNIAVAVINIPFPLCSMQSAGFGSFETYQQLYLNPLKSHLEARQVPFYELDTRFHTTIAPTEQNQYFDDARHTNQRGAQLFSAWAAENIAAWLNKEKKS